MPKCAASSPRCSGSTLKPMAMRGLWQDRDVDYGS